MAIIQKPDTLSMLGNMKKFIISSGSQISFELKEGSILLLSATYEPGMDGRATIDIKDIVESRLKYNILHTDKYEQAEIIKTFTAVIDGATTTFKVIRAGVANIADTPSNWLRANFLTWQPQNKKVTYHSPEWLTYYAQEACSVMLKAYFPGNTVQNINLGACEAGKAFTFNLQYALIAGKLGQEYPTHYDVWVENSSGTRLTYIQRYLYSDPLSEQEQWFLFENSLGGLDTIRAYGDTDFTGNHEHKLSTVDDISFEYDIDTERMYNKNTGFLDEYERKWLLDYFPAKRKYIYHSATIRSIVLKDSDVKYSASDLPSSYNFNYKFSDAESSVLLNLIRDENIPASITIPNLDAPDFHLPPRLSEYPRVPLHEGVILPAFDPHSEDLKVTTVGAILAAAVAKVLESIEAGEGGGELVDILRVDSSSEPSDFNVFSAARALIEMAKVIQDNGSEYFLSKINPDTAQGLITFLEGVEVGTFTTGALGSGAAVKMVDGTSYAEVDNLTVRQKATFRELIIESLKHIGGQLVLTPARMKCVRVVDGGTFYKCYFDTGDGEVSNEFVAGDFARCQVFTGSGTKFYWRLVTSVGEDWINLSKNSAAVGSDAPEAGDDITQLGNATDTARQSAIILSTVGIDAPSWKQYSGINSFSLEGKEATVFSKLGNKIDGKTVFKSDGKNLEEALDDVEERVLGLRIGGVNLLRNTGFLGDFNSLNLNSSALLTGNTAIDTNPLIHWVHSNVNIIDAPSKSGKGIHLGSLQQNTPVLEVGETYIVSFKAKGANLNIGLVNTVEVTLTGEYQLFEYKMIPTETKSYVFSMTGDADAYEIQLEKATIRSDYNYSIEDDLKTISQLQAINTITAAIKEADTSILGGLILTSMLQLGKYKDGIMQRVTSGVNGIYNNDDDPAIWAGGSFDDAIRTVQKFIDNPNIEPTEAEWAEMANIVMTHGGDGFFRGYVYALGGLFRGKIETSIDGHRVVIDPADKSIKMITAEGRTALDMKFNEVSTPLGWFSGADIKLYTYDGAGDIVMQSELSSNQVAVSYSQNLTGFKRSYATYINTGGLSTYIVDYDQDDPNAIPEFSHEFTVKNATSSGGLEISTKDLPTSGDGLDTGVWYSDNGTIKIKQ